MTGATAPAEKCLTVGRRVVRMSGREVRCPAAMSNRSEVKGATMRGLKPSLILATMGLIGLAVWASARVDQTGGAMATAAERLLASLGEEQKAKAAFSF